MLVHELRMTIAPEKYAEIIEPSDDSLKFHAVDEKNRERRFVFPNVIEKGVL